MNTDMTGLHEEFGVNIPTAPEIDPNQCFNEELLKSFKDTLDQQPHLHVNTILGSYATVVPDSNNECYPQLIWIDEIHDLESIRNTITGEVRPRGWQIRDGEDVNEECVNDYHQDIVLPKLGPPSILILDLGSPSIRGHSEQIFALIV